MPEVSSALVSLEIGKPVPEALAQAQVLDAGGEPSRLGARWNGGPAAVVFLRHFGCAACAEHVAQLAPRLHEFTRLGLRIVYVGNGAPNFIQGFIERNAIDPDEVDVVTDPSLKAFDAAGLVRSRASAFGAGALFGLARAMLTGNRQGAVEGDNDQQGGVLIVGADGILAYRYRDQRTGDHAPLTDAVDAALRITAPTMGLA